MAQLTLYLDNETEAKLKETANSAGMSLSRWVAKGDVPPDVEFGVAAAPWPA